eukprot:CAMPEP_0203770504 /NCGR_PEP_ID=MMETSP0099_2-20121227/2859_1 /ASSEMBLY_ACC=CAM_ASM_000209 /TAXON_ID=96639 /ORGANISM=" , Strain NY0313808BC1" /LENGTH=151 /DNA_ID=CAMNT_0050667671 /DNA_START=123 /DNA_END=578 /DNA_ORIENTATION=-
MTKLMIESEMKTGKVQTQVTVIEDLKGLGMRHLNRKMLRLMREGIQFEDKYYPGQLKRFYVVNTPRIFTFFWNVIKHFLDERTSKKVQIISGPGTEALLKIIDADQLPKFLGGERENDGDQFCKNEINPGRQSPQVDVSIKSSPTILDITQ